MQVKFIAMAIAAIAATPAFAQSNVKIYGSLDAMYETFSNDAGKAFTQTDATHKTSRLGFQGEEDLGGGLKAFFQLEERFQLDTATADDALRFKDKSWVGLSGGFGAVSFGRVPTALDIIYGGGKAANVDTIADWSSRKSQSDGRIDNGLSYTSPKFGPVTVYAHFGLEEANSAAPAPYGVSMNATFGPAFVEAGYQKDGLTANNMYKTYLINGGYTIGATKIYGSYVRSKGYQENNFSTVNGRRFTRYALGLDTKVSANGMMYVTLGQGKEKTAAGASQPTFTKLGVAYVHSLSKRTQLIGALSVEKQDAAYGYATDLKDTRVGLQAGLRHGF